MKVIQILQCKVKAGRLVPHVKTSRYIQQHSTRMKMINLDLEERHLAAQELK